MCKPDEFLPEKKPMKRSNIDLPFIANDLKILDRKIKRAYAKHKRSDKYDAFNLKFKKSFEKASRSYFENQISDLIDSEPDKAYSLL